MCHAPVIMEPDTATFSPFSFWGPQLFLPWNHMAVSYEGPQISPTNVKDSEKLPISGD